jgi:hypothetical protein
MARHLAIKRTDGTVKSSAPCFDERLTAKLSKARAGVYRVSVTGIGGGSVALDVGRRIADPAREAKRLAALGAAPAKKGDTGHPGVQGFQRAADAASYAASNRKAETRRLAGWLAEHLAETE